MSSNTVNNETQNHVIASLKAYAKLCSKPSHRNVVMLDKVFLGLLTNFLGENDTTVMTYVVKILLLLTETKEDSITLGNVPGLEAAIASASEMAFSPAILKNLMIVSSRIQTSRSQIKQESGDIGIPVPGGGTLTRKFVARKSKQLVFQFDDIDEALKIEIERSLLSKKGVISVYFNMEQKRIIMRTLLTIETQDMADVLFDCGCDVVSQIVTIGGVEEHFVMYASERQNKPSLPLPGYLDDDIEVSDPKSCIVTNEYAKAKASGGWFSSISSFVRDTLF